MFKLESYEPYGKYSKTMLQKNESIMTIGHNIKYTNRYKINYYDGLKLNIA